MDKQCMCGNPDCDGCESITLFRGYEAEYVEGLKAWTEKAKIALSGWIDVAEIEKIAGHLIKVTKDLLSEMKAEDEKT